jgi:hypothetical protein
MVLEKGGAMPEERDDTATEAVEVGEIRSTCCLLEWVFESYEANAPESEARRMELFEGMGFVVRAMVDRLGEIHGRLSS